MAAKSKIFLSYARKDEEKVNELYRKLSGAGFDPWIDTKNIFGGEDWQRALKKAIQNSDFFVACLSESI